MQVWDAFVDGTVDTLKLIPFLFVTYLLMELIEHRTSDQTRTLIRKAGKFGPIIGGGLGAFPQCGFSAAAASLFAGRVITAGTLIAVFLSTSDEMLPIFLSSGAPISLIAKVLLIKVIYGAVYGFAVDFLFRRLNERKIGVGIHGICTKEHCHCEESILKSALKHTFSILLVIFLISLGLNLLLMTAEPESFRNQVLNQPVIGQLLAALIGLIPNCAASVVLTELYLEKVLSGGAMMAGLLVSAGVGILVLVRTNRKRKENAVIIAILYLGGVLGGLITQLLGLL